MILSQFPSRPYARNYRLYNPSGSTLTNSQASFAILILECRGTIDNPKTTYVLQSSRLVRLEKQKRKDSFRYSSSESLPNDLRLYGVRQSGLLPICGAKASVRMQLHKAAATKLTISKLSWSLAGEICCIRYFQQLYRIE
ncbi:hypothetical protein AFLA_003237 [Aspergillus flavus NRRL3357]|nr:hypothetical protein AFLA_003237 [Aspergillus flavus NRRL3357]